MGRAPCCDQDGLKKGPWAPEEDRKLVAYIQKHGCGNWRTLPKNAELQRCGKSCRLRWTNYLRPDIKRGKFSLEEEDMIIQLHSMLGNKWSVIAARLPGRTDNEIKNYWNTRIRKKLLHMGIDPVTHGPRLDLLELSSILNTPLRSTSWTGHLSSLSGVQNLVDPEILRLAASVMSPRLETDPQCLSDQRFQHNQHHQQLIQDQLQTAIHGVPPCVPLWSDEASLRVMEHNVEEYRDPSTGYGNGYYYVPELNHATLNPSQENGISSVLSVTTSSSSMPGNSDSPCIIGSGSPDDEKESYCSNLLNYETIPDLLDMDLCNGMQQLIGDSELSRPWNIQLY